MQRNAPLGVGFCLQGAPRCSCDRPLLIGVQSRAPTPHTSHAAILLAASCLPRLRPPFAVLLIVIAAQDKAAKPKPGTPGLPPPPPPLVATRLGAWRR